MRKQTHITYIRHEPSYKQLEEKTNLIVSPKNETNSVALKTMFDTD